MASLIEGYNYDIFISYRQKDNKYEGWVTEFVDNLKKELEATFKEEISVYFDINPHDGLLETHDVDASIKDKLKCLIFIPIISRTYCDPKSFAWEHEFKAFVEQALNDQFGLKIKLPNGNFANRVLPIRIHDLESTDIKLCESVLGEVVRGIEFIYKSAGVNRPLTPSDYPEKNQYKTFYRDQINKVANAIKENISGFKGELMEFEIKPKEFIKITLPEEKTRNKTKKVLIYSLSLLVILAVVLVLIKINSLNKEIEKSIAVLPFRNDSSDTTNIYFINGVMEDIVNSLQKIKDLRVISRTSVEQYRNLTKSIPEIAKELGVNYIIEGSGQRSGNKIHLSVQLLRAAKEGHLWGNSFERELYSVTEIFDLQRQISETIASELKAVITPEEKRLIEKRPTDNLEAYEAYLKGQFYLTRFTPEALDSAMRYFELAKENDPEYALAYSGICDVWAYRQQWGLVTPSEGNPKAMEAIMKAYMLDSSNAVVLSSLAGKKTWGMFDWSGGESGFKKSLSLNPNNAMTRAAYSHLLNILGRPEEALEQVRTARKLDPMNPFIITFSAIDFMMARKYDEAIKEFNEALQIEPGYPFALTNLWQALYLSGKTKEAYATYKTFWGMVDPESQEPIEQGYLKDGINGACLSLADRLEKLWTISQNQFFAPFDIAILYSIGNDVDKSIYWLEQAYKFRDPNVPYLLLPSLENVRNDPRFKNLCEIMKLPWKVKT
jgi:TolB-like protein/tetratricopeptide (TPR) repeat protein